MLTRKHDDKQRLGATTSASRKQPTIPVIDLHDFTCVDRRLDFLVNLRHAARDVGFFYLVGHGVDNVLTQQIWQASKRFFALPQGEKNAISMANSPHFRGYTQLGHELTRGMPDRREQIDIGAELPALELSSNDPAWMRLQGPNQWPSRLPELREITLEWSATLRNFAIRRLHAFSVALEQPETALDGMEGITDDERVVALANALEPEQVAECIREHYDGAVLPVH